MSPIVAFGASFVDIGCTSSSLLSEELSDEEEDDASERTAVLVLRALFRFGFALPVLTAPGGMVVEGE